MLRKYTTESCPKPSLQIDIWLYITYFMLLLFLLCALFFKCSPTRCIYIFIYMCMHIYKYIFIHAYIHILYIGYMHTHKYTHTWNCWGCWRGDWIQNYKYSKENNWGPYGILPNTNSMLSTGVLLFQRKKSGKQSIPWWSEGFCHCCRVGVAGNSSLGADAFQDQPSWALQYQTEGKG